MQGDILLQENHMSGKSPVDTKALGKTEDSEPSTELERGPPGQPAGWSYSKEVEVTVWRCQSEAQKAKHLNQGPEQTETESRS